MANDVARFAALVALAYHEARNVRHLRRDGLVAHENCGGLINQPVKSEEAWRAIQPLLQSAAASKSATDAEKAFQRRFGISLEGLVELSRHPGWKSSKFGGNRWAEIDSALIELRDAIDARTNTDALFDQVAGMKHNTGTVREKLAKLNTTLATSG